MSNPSPLSEAHDRIVRGYLVAKDHQRPHHMPAVFAEDARFVSHIDFDPALDDVAEGCAAITEVFRRLGAQGESITTLYLSDTLRHADDGLHFRWVVAVSDRASGIPWVAWGDYAWQFAPDGDRATSLEVWMSHREVLTAEVEVFPRLWSLAEPWCTRDTLATVLPPVRELDGLRAWLRS
ncbi:MAG: hypothetical protein AAF602_21765 [Myxococcota bacterium]